MKIHYVYKTKVNNVGSKIIFTINEIGLIIRHICQYI